MHRGSHSVQHSKIYGYRRKISKRTRLYLGRDKRSCFPTTQWYSQLKFTEVVRVAKWLGVTIDDLMDDAALLQDKELRSKMHPAEKDAEKSGALVGTSAPGSLSVPWTPTRLSGTVSRVQPKVPRPV